MIRRVELQQIDVPKYLLFSYKQVHTWHSSNDLIIIGIVVVSTVIDQTIDIQNTVSENCGNINPTFTYE
jgi:hypothetical protein